MDRLKGKVAFIPGGGNGIGRAAAMLFASENGKVVIAELDAEAGRGSAAEIVKSGGTAIFVETDASSDDSVQKAVALAVKGFGRIDVLYNNVAASYADDGPVTKVTDEVLWRTMTTNVVSVLTCSRHFIPEIARAGGGSVINTTSVAALMGLRGLAAYSAAKGAVAALTRSMALEFAQDKIRVNAIAPTQTQTERAMAMNSRWDTGAQGDKNLLGSANTIEIAMLVLCLASDESRVTTGQVIPVDSGLTIS